MKHDFNDGLYYKTIEEWENDLVPVRATTDRIGWSIRLLPVVLVVGGFGARTRWELWLCLIALAYVFVLLFTFLEELNENIRFVRHQNRALRKGLRDTFEQFVKYNDPDRNVSVFDAIATVHRHWEDPR